MECSKQGDVKQKQDAAAIKQHVIESAKKFGVELKYMQMKAVLCFFWRQGHICVPAHWLWIYGTLPYVFDKLRG